MGSVLKVGDLVYAVLFAPASDLKKKSNTLSDIPVSVVDLVIGSSENPNLRNTQPVEIGYFAQAVRVVSGSCKENEESVQFVGESFIKGEATKGYDRLLSKKGSFCLPRSSLLYQNRQLDWVEKESATRVKIQLPKFSAKEATLFKIPVVPARIKESNGERAVWIGALMVCEESSVCFPIK